MTEENLTNLEQNRLEKMHRLRELGMEPYPTKAHRTHTSQEAIQALEEFEKKPDGETVQATLVGRIRSMRPMGKLVFAHIEDGFGRIPDIGHNSRTALVIAGQHKVPDLRVTH